MARTLRKLPVSYTDSWENKIYLPEKIELQFRAEAHEYALLFGLKKSKQYNMNYKKRFRDLRMAYIQKNDLQMDSPSEERIVIETKHQLPPSYKKIQSSCEEVSEEGFPPSSREKKPVSSKALDYWENKYTSGFEEIPKRLLDKLDTGNKYHPRPHLKGGESIRQDFDEYENLEQDFEQYDIAQDLAQDKFHRLMELFKKIEEG